MDDVRHNPAQHQYELDAPHGMAVAVYHQQGDKLVFTHTEVPAADEGRGIGARLVKAALTDATKRGFGVVPACSFVAAVIRRNPELVR
ncbi:MAG TPA: GNAT family N-acetyltransferase [Reyranellaceae bacterium]|nr:GNAT family N-acetyltransferase [Reyranellaceae bacterium]